MCGIVGIVRFDGRPVHRDEIGAMVGSIRHRGPDDDGLLVEGGVGIGMRRLAIVDLSPHGHQPLFNEDENIVVVFNGEIYNHRDIRSRLEAEGHAFRGSSDTEVLVHGYEQFGARRAVRRASRACSRSPSMIGARRRLFLARDGFGIKPLYMRRTANQISFGSEIRALWRSTARGPLSVDSAFTHTFLRIGYVPSPRHGVRRHREAGARDGARDRSRDGRDRCRDTFYRLAPAVIDDRGPDALVEKLRELLNLVGSPAPDGGRADRSVPFGRPRFERVDRVRQSPRRAAQDLLDRVLVVRSGRRDRVRRGGRAPAPATRTSASISGPANLGDLDPIVDALEEPLADSAVLPLWYLCRGTAAPREGCAVGRGRRRGARRLRPLFLGPRSSTTCGRSCCAHASQVLRRDRAAAVALARRLQRRPPRGEARGLGPAGRRRCAICPGSTSSAGTNGGRWPARATTAPPSATKRCSRPRASSSSIPCRPSSTWIFRRCCSTTC